MTELKKPKGYVCWVLDDASRDALLARFPTKYERVIAEHVTLIHGVEEPEESFQATRFEVIGHVDAWDGLQALVVRVDGQETRPDGKPYHCTWSLDPTRFNPVQAAEAIALGYDAVSPAIPFWATYRFKPLGL